MRIKLITAAQQMHLVLINKLQTSCRHCKCIPNFALVPGSQQRRGESTIDILRVQYPRMQAADSAVSHKIKDSEIRGGETF